MGRPSRLYNRNTSFTCTTELSLCKQLDVPHANPKAKAANIARAMGLSLPANTACNSGCIRVGGSGGSGDTVGGGGVCGPVGDGAVPDPPPPGRCWEVGDEGGIDAAVAAMSLRRSPKAFQAANVPAATASPAPMGYTWVTGFSPT